MKTSAVYDRTKKEPFFETDRCYFRSLRDKIALKKMVTKFRSKWELECHLIPKYQKYLNKPSKAPIEVKWIDPVMGHGVFATAPIKKGTFICEYTGLITNEDLIESDNRYIFNLTVGDDETGYVIDARYSGNVARRINHSSKPNLESITLFIEGLPRVLYIANRDIKKNEQLFVDYGEEYWHQWTPSED
jgi:SET domain-containing protein